ncbi:recombinase family protein [Microbacterium sp. 2P01SA-2]|uniref:recombinase family protein n=1 Tax=unclassified Microbacterium TaxID=2609290 RepID=UPI00399F8ABE
MRRLDRLTGRERVLIETLQNLDARQVNIVSLTEPMDDTTSPMGRALVGIVAVFAQLRVGAIGENTQRGLEYARAHGPVGGQPNVMTPERVAAAQRLRAENHSWESIGRIVGVGAATVRRAPAQTITPIHVSGAAARNGGADTTARLTSTSEPCAAGASPQRAPTSRSPAPLYPRRLAGRDQSNRSWRAW